MYITENYSYTSVSAFFDEFFPGLIDPERIKKHREWFNKLKVKGEEATIKNIRGTDLFSLNIGTKHVGGVIVEYYPWEEIKKQRYFQTQNTPSGEILYIRQNTFEEIVKPTKHPKTVFEIAYIWVLPEYRNWKYGRNLWEYAFSRIKYLASDGDIFFTMSQSGSSGSGNGQRVFERVLQVEEETNGRNPDGTVKLTGVWLTNLEILLTTSIDLSRIGTRLESKPTESLARRFGMERVGLSRNLSQVWKLQL